jgi:glycine betaine/proline transport system substrate-binding protein
MNRKTKLSLTLLACALALSACDKQEDAPAATAANTTTACGKVTVASMNWQSAEVLANIDKFILSNGFGCEVVLLPGDTMPTLTAMMEKGQPDIAPEAWINAVRKPLERAVKQGRLHYAAEALKDGGIEGWWIPKYLADANPSIKTIDDALQHPELFPSDEQEGKGVVHNCPSGWTCQLTTENAFKAWHAADKGFVLLDTGSSAGLDGSIAKAYERKEAWLGYYWAPTSILGKYEMVKLDAGVPHNEEAWACNSKFDCANPVKNDWPRAPVFTVITDRFAKQGGPAVDYLNKRAWSNDTVNQLLSWMTDNQATGAYAARHFLKTQPAIWTPWVSAQVAEKIQSAL